MTLSNNQLFKPAVSLWYHENTTLKHNRERKKYLVCHGFVGLTIHLLMTLKNINSVAVPSAEPTDRRYPQCAPALHPGLCSGFTAEVASLNTSSVSQLLSALLTLSISSLRSAMYDCNTEWFQFLSIHLTLLHEQTYITHSVRRSISYRLRTYSQDPV